MLGSTTVSTDPAALKLVILKSLFNRQVIRLVIREASVFDE